MNESPVFSGPRIIRRPLKVDRSTLTKGASVVKPRAAKVFQETALVLLVAATDNRAGSRQIFVDYQRLLLDHLDLVDQS